MFLLSVTFTYEDEFYTKLDGLVLNYGTAILARITTFCNQRRISPLNSNM